MYADLTSKIDSMNKELKDLSSSMATRHDIVRLENKVDENYRALYDGYKLTYEKLDALKERVNEVNKNVERQDVEIRVIKGTK